MEIDVLIPSCEAEDAPPLTATLNCIKIEVICVLSLLQSMWQFF